MSLEEQQFTSRRRKEYEDLIKKPAFSETIIRIKMPCNIIVELKFSPLETIKSVINVIKENLEDPTIPFYI